MMTTDRPYYTFQTRYMELLALAEEHNAAEVFVTSSDWYVLMQCAGASKLMKQVDGQGYFQIDGRHFRRKPATRQPAGKLDLTGPEPAFEA